MEKISQLSYWNKLYTRLLYIADSLEQQQQIWHFWYCKHDKWRDNWSKQICDIIRNYFSSANTHNLAMSLAVAIWSFVFVGGGNGLWVWGGWGIHSSICRGCKPLFLWYYVCFNVCLKSAHTFVWFYMLSELKNIFLHTHTLVHANMHRHRQIHISTLQLTHSIHRETECRKVKFLWQSQSASFILIWKTWVKYVLLSLQYMFKLNRLCDLKRTPPPPHPPHTHLFASSKQE